jgi:hypothetical protein
MTLSSKQTRVSRPFETNNQKTKGTFMKKTILKTASAFTLFAVSTIITSTAVGGSLPVAPKEVTLTSRSTGGNYQTATYSFRHMSQDIQVTRNNMEILFEGRADYQNDYFQVSMVVDDNSFIYDLGAKSCADIKSTYPNDRESRQIVWLGGSDASPLKNVGTKTAPVMVGHCYLAYNNDEDGRVVTLFHVEKAVKNHSVTINEIEVLDILNSK